MADVFLFDRDTGITRRVSVRSDGEQATGGSYDPAISADGRWITYASYAANLVDNDTNGMADVFLFDRDTGTTRRVSVRSDGGQANGDSLSRRSAPTAAGSPTTRSRRTWSTTTPTQCRRVPVRPGHRHHPAGLGAQRRRTGHRRAPRLPAISADGRWITYFSYAANLVDDDTNAQVDVFLFDRDTGTTRRVSVRSDGTQATGGSYAPGDQRRRPLDHLLLVRGEPGRRRHQRSRPTCSCSTGTPAPPGGCRCAATEARPPAAPIEPAISADGRWITYYSYAANLVDNDTNDCRRRVPDPDVVTASRVVCGHPPGYDAGTWSQRQPPCVWGGAIPWCALLRASWPRRSRTGR